MKVEFSCATCKKCKPTEGDTSYCKYKTEFYPSGKIPCEHWAPSVSDVRLWIGRATKKARR